MAGRRAARGHSARSMSRGVQAGEREGIDLRICGRNVVGLRWTRMAHGAAVGWVVQFIKQLRAFRQARS